MINTLVNEEPQLRFTIGGECYRCGETIKETIDWAAAICRYLKGFPPKYVELDSSGQIKKLWDVTLEHAALELELRKP